MSKPFEHIPELHALGSDLEEWAEVRVRRDSIPKGGKLVEAYLTETEVIVMGWPEEDDEDHNCDAMGCGSLSHVLYRLPLSDLDHQRRTIERFCEAVEREAEANMLKTGKLEGAHYAAMRRLRGELRREP